VNDYQVLERAVKVLGPLEGRIMRAVWSGSVEPTFTVRDIQKITPELAYTTLMTTLSRLAEKGVLTQSRVPHQRAFDYRAAGSPSEFLATASREQANRMLEQFGDAALAAFAARLEALPPEQRERLRRAAGSD
jgi:predicted transcriptional regulator